MMDVPNWFYGGAEGLCGRLDVALRFLRLAVIDVEAVGFADWVRHRVELPDGYSRSPVG